MITILIIIILINVFVLSKLVFFPYPELFIYPYLTNHGLIPYTDILDQHFPGLIFFPVNLGTLGMHSPEIARYWQYGAVVIIHLILYLVAKKILGPKKALLANLIFLIWQPYFEGWVLWIDSFLPILILSSLYFLISKKNFWSGFFLGVALLFKQVIAPLIALVGLYILFKERKFKPAFIFSLGVLIPTLFLIKYVNDLGIWKDFIFWTVTFNTGVFAEMGRKYGTISEIARVVGVYGFAAFSFFDEKFRENTLLIGIFLIGSLASVYARFDFVHLQPSLPFVALLSAISINWLLKKKYLKVLIAIYILVAIYLLSQFYKGLVGSKIFFQGETERRVTQVVQRLSKKEDKIFSLGTMPIVYEMADRLPPGNVFVFQFPWFMTVAENRILSGIISDPPKVVVRDVNAVVEGKKLILYMPKINDYINEHYKVIDKIDEIEIMVRK
ncbi:MAG TPA: glycosyltransferase family 39 protein [Patescibacteria group bacterium]|nr:glycosyltransferase family 39 protein [Patescibacteria group bacterium]